MSENGESAADRRVRLGPRRPDRRARAVPRAAGRALVYFGDTARVPYGNKSRETVTRFSLEIARFLLRQDIKCLLVACNTASSYALETLKQRLDIPVVGVIDPAVGVAVTAGTARAGAPASASSARTATVASGAYAAAIERLAPGTRGGLARLPAVRAADRGGLDRPPGDAQVAEEYLAELRASRLDSLILGCTHYPLIAPLLRGADRARRCGWSTRAPRRRWPPPGCCAARGLLAAAGPRPVHHFYLSDERLSFARVAEAFLGRALPPTAIVDQTDLPWFERSIPTLSRRATRSCPQAADDP